MRMIVHAAALLAAGQAAALSCERPDPVRSFLDAEASPDAYVVLHGRLDFDEGLMPAPVGVEAPPTVPVPARFEGVALGADGFGAAAPGAVTLRPACLATWCGALPTGETWLLFARATPAGLEVESGPCGGWTFMDPDAATLDAVAACARGGPCEPAP